MKKLIAKYKGKYKELKPRGYKFYGVDYKVYLKTFVAEMGIWMYVKDKFVRIDNLGIFTGTAINWIIKNRDRITEILENDPCYRSLWDGKEYKTVAVPHTFFSIRLNTETNEIFYCDSEVMRKEFKEKEELIKLKEAGNEEPFYKYLERWRKVNIPLTMIDEVLKLYDEGVIELVEEDI